MSFSLFEKFTAIFAHRANDNFRGIYEHLGIIESADRYKNKQTYKYESVNKKEAFEFDYNKIADTKEIQRSKYIKIG